MVSGERGRGLCGGHGAGSGQYPKSGQQPGPVQVSFVGTVYKETTPALDHIDNRSVQPFGNGGTSFASSQITPLPDMLLAHIIGRMYNNGAAKDIIVPALFH